jgi:hypothetical protein
MMRRRPRDAGWSEGTKEGFSSSRPFRGSGQTLPFQEMGGITLTSP